MGDISQAKILISYIIYAFNFVPSVIPIVLSKKNVLLLDTKCLSIYNFDNNENKIKPKGENIFKNKFN